VLPTDLTVTAVVERDQRFLLIEERSSGVVSINQPGGRIDSDESPEEAVIRETHAVARCEIAVTGLLGVYLWIHPQTRQQFLRLVYTADMNAEDHSGKIRDGVHAVHWYSIADMRHRRRELRSPIVLRCVEDYVSGLRERDSLLAGLCPIKQNVAAVMANARLV
jgi:ADP-ribose pyrophosphatase YjhB (NUDIX family)